MEAGEMFQPTYMWQMCNKIFKYNTSENAVGQVDELCTEWFRNSLERCSEIIFLRPESEAHSWLLSLLMKLIFTKSKIDDSISVGMPKNPLHPGSLTKDVCSRLFVQMAKDYIDVAPKYSVCLEDTFHYVVFLKTVFAFLSIYLLFVFTKNIWKKIVSSAAKDHLFNTRKLTCEKRIEANRLRWLSDRSLERQKFETSHLKVERTNVHKIFCEPPLIAVKVKKTHLAEALVALIRTDPVVDELRNGIPTENCIRGKDYALQKMNLFLNDRTYCRITMDIGYDEDNSDTNEPVSLSKFQDNYSAGDQPYHSRYAESTVEESADTSSANSVKYLCSSRQKRYTMKYSAPTNCSISKSRQNVARKDSSNSITISRKSSQTLIRKPSDLYRSGHGRTNQNVVPSSKIYKESN